MGFERSQKNSIWNRYYGNSYSAIDVFGRSMNKDNFEADHIWPESIGGKTVIENGIPLSSLSNQNKSDDVNGTINGKYFEVKNSGTHGIGVLYVDGFTVSK